MTPVIKQSVRFSYPPEVLFELYMDSAKHSEATGGHAKISRIIGGAFTAFDGQLWGRNLHIVPNRMIVQAWRSSNFNRSDPDSILILEFRPVAKGCSVELIHVNVPPQDRKGVSNGWPTHITGSRGRPTWRSRSKRPRLKTMPLLAAMPTESCLWGAFVKV